MKKFGEWILWQRARDYVSRYKPILIGVTGSTGKTFTKEAITLALRADRHARSSPKSYNTHVGVALSVLGAGSESTTRGWMQLLVGSKVREIEEEEPDTIVLELAANRPGDIDFFATQLTFQIGVVTNIGSTHLELFDTKELVAHEKMSLIVTLPPDGFAILNADDPLVFRMSERTKAQVILFGTNEDADVRLMRANRLTTGGFAIEVALRGRHYEMALPHIIATHQLQSILAALAVALVLKIDIKHALNNLRHLMPPPGRMRLLKGVNNSQILDDSYNASPEATVAALYTFTELPAERRIVILGDMLELGRESIHWHERIGEQVASTADIFIAVGENMRRAQGAALRASHLDTHHFNDSTQVGKWLPEYVHPGDLILVKGSRAMHMEEIVKRLLAYPDRDAGQVVT